MNALLRESLQKRENMKEFLSRWEWGPRIILENATDIQDLYTPSHGFIIESYYYGLKVKGTFFDDYWISNKISKNNLIVTLKRFLTESFQHLTVLQQWSHLVSSKRYCYGIGKGVKLTESDVPMISIDYSKASPYADQVTFGLPKEEWQYRTYDEVEAAIREYIGERNLHFKEGPFELRDCMKSFMGIDISDFRLTGFTKSFIFEVNNRNVSLKESKCWIGRDYTERYYAVTEEGQLVTSALQDRLVKLIKNFLEE